MNIYSGAYMVTKGAQAAAMGHKSPINKNYSEEANWLILLGWLSQQRDDAYVIYKRAQRNLRRGPERLTAVENWRNAEKRVTEHIATRVQFPKLLKDPDDDE